MDGSQLSDLRLQLSKQNVAGFLVPRADEHLGEYVPPSADRLAWLTGFTGSAGLAVALMDAACLFVDGRYVLQAATQTDPALWQRRHVTEQPPAEWLAATAPGVAIGYDPWLLSEEQLARFTNAGCLMVPLDPNPIDVVWRDRPAPPMAPAVAHPLAFAGMAASEKIDQVAATLRAAGQDAAVLSDPASIAWLLNIRGADIAFTPFALGFALVGADAQVTLFMSPEKLAPPVRDWLGERVAIAGRAALPQALSAWHGQTVRVDAGNTPAWFAQTLRAAGARVVAGMDPCLLPKACKNPVEQQGARIAHGRDAIALCRFLAWLDVSAVGVSEMAAAAQLLALRRDLADFRGESFPAISAAGEHGAIMHYRVDAQSDRVIGADELYLIDSGAQFGAGTTDVTRTIWTGPGTPPPPLRDRYTRVLKGHIAIATLVFPSGVTGAHLDSFARAALWQAGLDFDHGTGHGVGSYLSVHEGPVSLSRLARPVPLAAGMVLSNEPGFYAPGGYGIRLENLLLVTARPFPHPPESPESLRDFLAFETLTLAPWDRRLINVAMLTQAEHDWLDQYHARVLAEIGGLLPDGDAKWLAAACAPL